MQRHNVVMIVALGGASDRLDYSSTLSGSFQPEKNYSDSYPAAVSTSTATYNTSDDIELVTINVADCEPINMTDNNLQAISTAYDIWANPNEPTSMLIHCDSGVGRTGQLNVILHLVAAYTGNPLASDTDSYHKSDPAFFAVANNYIKTIIKNTDEDPVLITQNPHMQIKYEYMQDQANILLGYLRKHRFSIQTETQFHTALQQALLVIAYRSGHSPNELAKLRMAMQIPDPMITVATVHNVVDAPTLSSDDDLASAASTPLNSKPAL